MTQADWGVVFGEAVTLIAVALLTVVGTLLHATGLELSLDQEFDLERTCARRASPMWRARLAAGSSAFS